MAEQKSIRRQKRSRKEQYNLEQRRKGQKKYDKARRDVQKEESTCE